MNLEVLVLEYGFEVVLVSIIAIALVGAMKVAFKKQLDRIDKSNRKAVYEVASIIAVVLLSSAYLVVTGAKDMSIYLSKMMASYGAMKVMYPLYENFKLRDLVQLIGGLLKEKYIKGGDE